MHVAVVTVADDHGRGPLAIPLWYDYQPGGEIILVTDGSSRKAQLIRKAGRVTVCAQTRSCFRVLVGDLGPHRGGTDA